MTADMIQRGGYVGETGEGQRANELRGRGRSKGMGEGKM